MPEGEYRPQPEPTPGEKIESSKKDSLLPDERQTLEKILASDDWSKLRSFKLRNIITGKEEEKSKEAALLQKASDDPAIRDLVRSRILTIVHGTKRFNGFELGVVSHACSITVDEEQNPEFSRPILEKMRTAFAEEDFRLAGNLMDAVHIPEGEARARTLCIEALNAGDDRRVIDITQSFPFPTDLMRDPELFTAVQTLLIPRLHESTFESLSYTIPHLFQRFIFPKPISSSPDLAHALHDAIQRVVSHRQGNLENIADLSKKMGMTDDDRRAIAVEVITEQMHDNRGGNIPNPIPDFGISYEELGRIGRSVLLHALATDEYPDIRKSAQMTSPKNDPEIQEALRRAITRTLNTEGNFAAYDLITHLSGSDVEPITQTVFAHAIAHRAWNMVDRLLVDHPTMMPDAASLRAGLQSMSRTDRYDNVPPHLLDRLPFDFKNLPLTDDDRRNGATRVDAEPYERARGVRNESLRKELWGVLLGQENPKIVTDAPFDRAKEYPRCPPHLFGALVARDCASPALLQALDTYTKIHEGRSGGTQAMQRLEFTVITIVAEANRLGYGSFLRDIVPRLITDPVASAEGVVTFLEKFSQIVKLVNLIPRDVGEDREPIPWETVAEGMTTIEELARGTEDAVRQGFQQVIGVEVNSEELTRVEEEWGGDINELRSIIVLAAKYKEGHPEGLPLFHETLRAIFNDRWHDFRYDTTDAIVADQIGHLTDTERARWTENLPHQGIGEVKVERNDTPERRREMLRGHIRSGLDQGHLTSYQASETSAQHDIALMLRGVLDGTRTRTEIDDERRALGVILGERTFVGKAASATEIDRASLETTEGLTAAAEQLRRVLEVPLPADANAKAKGRRGFQQQLAGWIEERLALGIDKEKTIRASLDITDGTNQKDLARLRDDRDLARDLARLIDLDDDELRQLNLKNKDGALKEQDALRDLLTRIQATLKKRDSAFAQDVENITTTLFTAPAAPQQFRDLTIEEGDHPKTLFEAGYYPMGCGSCQNFEGDVRTNKCLLAYVADADKKILTIRKPDRTILARAIVKLGRLDDETKTPIIFLEPTYTSVNKKDHDFDEEINKYMLAKAQSMGTRVRVVRGALKGETSVRIAASRNYYQYEDGGAGAADNAGLGIKAGTYAMNAYEIEGQAPQSTPPEKRVRAVRRRQGAQEALRTPA